MLINMLLCCLSFFPTNTTSDLDSLVNLSLEDLLNIEVTFASNVMTSAEKQPASTTTITRDQIELSGARTLSELIMTYVPGYFVVEDQDDVIAGFRGFSPDNNSKVLLLLNGRNINTEWFWGPSDGVLNGISMDYIEQVQVIRGPGSVTLGQGALLGVINVITRKAKDTGAAIRMTGGADGLGQASLHGEIIKDKYSGYFFVNRSDFTGQAVRDEGWANNRSDQGLTVFERNHRLKGTDSTTIYGSIGTENVAVSVFHNQQTRDLYNFFRDREEVSQNLTSVFLKYRRDLSRNVTMTLNGDYHLDDFELFSHEGFVMGGTREIRKGLTALFNINDLWEGNRLAVGFEYKSFESGQANAKNNNFIINSESTRLDDVNNTHRWVFPNDTDLLSLVVEDVHPINDRLDIFAAFRYDDHPDWGTKITPRLGMLYSTKNNVNLRLSYQTGFRGATGVHYAGGFESDGLLREDNFDEVENNAILYANGDRNLPSTKPEEMSSLEFAIDYIKDNRWRINSVSFYNTMKNVIDVGVFYVGDPLVGDFVGTDIAGDWGGFWFFKNNSGKINQWGNETSLSYYSEKLNATLSHSLVQILDADDSQFGGSMYVAGEVGDPKVKAYPANVTRLNLIYKPNQKWSLAYNHLYYYDWTSPRNNSVSGNHMANGAVSFQLPNNFRINLQVKNILDQDKLYPMNNNVNEDLTDGTPSLEARTWWLSLNYSF